MLVYQLKIIVDQEHTQKLRILFLGVQLRRQLLNFPYTKVRHSFYVFVVKQAFGEECIFIMDTSCRLKHSPIGRGLIPDRGIIPVPSYIYIYLIKIKISSKF